MTIAAIVRDYEEAKDKRAQIQILADMNLCEKKEMRTSAKAKKKK